MLLLPLAVSFAVAAGSPGEPGLLRTFDVAAWSTPAVDAEAPRLTRGAVVWSIACEASGSIAADGSPGPQKCFAARLRLPRTVQSPLGDGSSANDFFRALETCLQTKASKAPDAVVAAVARYDDEAVNNALAGKNALVVVGRLDESFQLGVTLNSGDKELALPETGGSAPLYLVDAPRAWPVAEALAHHRFKRALALAKQGVLRARDPEMKLRAAGNLALVAILAHDKSAVPGDDIVNLEATTDASAYAMANVATAASWARGEIVLGDNPCS